jgi:hypothetical protein
MHNPDDRQRYQDILQRLAQYGTLDDPEVAFRLSAVLEGFLNRWECEVLPFIAAGGAELRFVEGPYGRGKTHLLQALEVAAQRAGFVTSRVECGLQQKPFGSLEETYRVVADNMSLAVPQRNGSRPGLSGILAGSSAEQLTYYQNSPRGNPAYRNLVLTYAKRAGAGGRHDEVTQSLRALLHNDINRRVTFREFFETAWRLGVRVPRPVGKITKRNAAVWLRSLLSLPHWLGYKGLVVLFDETGADLSFKSPFGSSGDHQRHLANLRNLVDQLATGGTPGCSVIYATTRDLVEIARQDYPALSQRVERREEMDTFDVPTPNQRAIWCKLDELTAPAPDTPEFFEQLGEKLLGLAMEAGVSERRLAAEKEQLSLLAKKMSQNLTQAAVREFVKTVAGNLVRKE